ncbi:MAG: YicC/YloC family endoribonuclease [Verrucomicrobiota bacterium]
MQSMTGFGRGFFSTGEWSAAVEVTSVNRKQAEVIVQLPREFSELESRVRKRAGAAVSRGRVQASIAMERSVDAAPEMKVDLSLAKAFAEAFAKISAATGNAVVPAAADFLRQPGIIISAGDQSGPEPAWAAIAPALETALATFTAMRTAEGGHLQEDLAARLDILGGHVAAISAEAPARPVRQRELLLKRLADAGLTLDVADERVLKEIALFADRCDISEELTRLDSHFKKFRSYLADDPAPGRALDFLCQEIFREFNTIGSKANDAGISHAIVEAKTELEKIREQVQNVE